MRPDENAAHEAPRPARPVDLGASCFSGLDRSVHRWVGRPAQARTPQYRGKGPIHEHDHAGESDDDERSPEPEANRVRIFDTTLRDGEQSPGASMNMAEKVEVARALAALGVDVIEAGFPIASVRATSRRSGPSPPRSPGRRSAAWPGATSATSTAPGRRSSMPRRRGSTSSSPPRPSTASTS